LPALSALRKTNDVESTSLYRAVYKMEKYGLKPPPSRTGS
jgi:hypothetical protein